MPWLKTNTSHSKSAREPERPKRTANHKVATVKAIVIVWSSAMEASTHREVANPAANAPRAANGPATSHSKASAISRATVASPHSSDHNETAAAGSTPNKRSTVTNREPRAVHCG